MSDKLPAAATAADIPDAAADYVDVEVPEWKRTIRIRSLPGDEGADLGERVNAAGTAGGSGTGHTVRVLLLAATIVDPTTGALIYDTPELVAQLGKKHLKVLMRLEKIAMRLNYDEAAAKNA